MGLGLGLGRLLRLLHLLESLPVVVVVRGEMVLELFNLDVPLVAHLVRDRVRVRARVRVLTLQDRLANLLANVLA